MAEDDEGYEDPKTGEFDFGKLFKDIEKIIGPVGKEKRFMDKLDSDDPQSAINEINETIANEKWVEKAIQEMAENGTYKFFQKTWSPFEGGAFPDFVDVEEEYDVDDISDEIKDQFVDDDWKHILPFKWFGK